MAQNSYSVKMVPNAQREKKDGTCSLYLQVIINGDVLMVPLLLSWPLKYVDRKTGTLIRRRKDDPDLSDYNIIILAEMAKINEIFKVYRLRNKTLTRALFKREYTGFSRRLDFIEYFEYKIRYRKSKMLISEGSARINRSTYKRLKQYQSSIMFHEIDRVFLEEFAAWLKIEKENEDSTIWGRIKDVKAYLQLADEDGIGVNEDFRKYSNKSPAGRITFLDQKEIDILVMLYNSRRLGITPQKVLRAFLFSCFTGLRISDIQAANWAWVDINNTMRFVPKKGQKRNREISFPLTDVALSLIERRTGAFFDIPTDQEVNRTLKEIAAEAGIKKHLTFHVARHSFATHYYRETNDIISLQHILGHSKLETTMVYVHLREEDKLNGMNKLAEAFKRSLPVNRLVSR